MNSLREMVEFSVRQITMDGDGKLPESDADLVKLLDDSIESMRSAMDASADALEAAESLSRTSAEQVARLEGALRQMRGDGGFPMWPSISVTAAHLREIASELGHTEAVADCRHCTYAYAAKSLERFMEQIDAALTAIQRTTP